MTKEPKRNNSAEPREAALAQIERDTAGFQKMAAKRAKDDAKVCPECGHVFQGNGWDGIDAHWRSKHKTVMQYEEAWPMLQAGTYDKGSKIAADTARYEALAREHGADLSEEGFNEALRKLARPK